MKLIYKLLFGSLFILGFSFSAFSQIKLNTSDAKYPTTSELSLADRQIVLANAEELINKYAKVMTLYDKKKGKVTSEKVNLFRALFNSTAKIERDFEQYQKGEMISPRTYADAVYNRMEGRGFQVQIETVKLKRIENDEIGYWVLVLELDKSRFNYVASDHKVKMDAGGKPLEQEMRIDVVKSKLDKVKITTITPTGKGYESDGIPDIVAEYIRYMGPSFSLYKPSVKTSLSDSWNTNHADASFETSGKLGFSIGADFATNRFSPGASTKKNLFVTAGIHYYSYKVDTKMEDFYINPSFDDSATATIGGVLPYRRLVGPVSVEEELSFGVLKIPLGIGYRLLKRKKSAFMLYGKVVPSIIMSTSGDLTGKGTYDAYLPNAMWRYLEEGASDLTKEEQDVGFAGFDVGADKEIKSEANPNKKGFILGFQISPTYYYDFSEFDSSWSLLIGLDLNMNPGSFLQHDASDSDLFKNVNDYETSILQHYASGTSMFALGFRIGLQHRLRTNP